MTPNLFHIPEPNLTFGYNQKVPDPRDGLTLFGPFNQKNILPSSLNVGIIGAKKQRDFLRSYLEKIHLPILSDNDIARPFFPGLGAAFGIKINLDNIKEINIAEEDIAENLKFIDGHIRVFNLCELFAQPLLDYAKEEELPITVWFVAIPFDIYKYGRPKSRIAKSEENITKTVKKSERNLLSLFDEINKEREPYEFEVNFHNQLKAKLLNEKIVTQIIKDETIAYQDLWLGKYKNAIEKIESEKIMEADKAWSISTAMYYKSGGIPWKLGDVREKVCYVGLVYKKIDEDKSSKSACCAAQMFLDSGDGMVFRGVKGQLYNPKTKEFHLSFDDAKKLLQASLKAFKDKHNRSPEEIFIHSKTRFNDEEWNGFLEVVGNDTKLVGVRIRRDGNFKLYRGRTYAVPRGTVFQYEENKAFLWTNGFVTRLETQMGLETPNPLSIEITRGQSDIQTVCKDILALTKLNYNSCKFADGLPVTLRFADSIGEILTSGKNLQLDVLPFKHYI